jgi:hypothetical protein
VLVCSYGREGAAVQYLVLVWPHGRESAAAVQYLVLVWPRGRESAAAVQYLVANASLAS